MITRTRCAAISSHTQSAAGNVPRRALRFGFSRALSLWWRPDAGWRSQHGYRGLKRSLEQSFRGWNSSHWFRKPASSIRDLPSHPESSCRLQILTILLSRGIFLSCGEAYAFGVMWSFALKALAVLVLRYKGAWRRANFVFL